MRSAFRHLRFQILDLLVVLPVDPQVKALDERLRAADRDAGVYNAREGLLGLPITDYSQVGAGWGSGCHETQKGE